MIRMLVFTGATVLSIADAGVSHAGDVERFFGHSVWISKDAHTLGETLRLDDRAVLTDDVISLQETTLVDGTPVLIGVAGPGGNICDPAPFVISFPANAAPRVDGPVETCNFAQIEIGKRQIDFSALNYTRDGTRHWAWTVADGLTELVPEADEPDDSKGWQALRERSIGHPGEVFDYGPIADQIAALLAADLSAYRRVLSGTGSGEFKGDDYIGTTCEPHLCGIVEALVFLSAKDQRVFAAWKPNGKKIEVRPRVGEWPEKARLELKSWAAQWERGS